MIPRVKHVLEQVGIAVDEVNNLACLIVAPPQGTIDPSEISRADNVQLALLAAIVAAADTRQWGKALQRLLAFLHTVEADLSDYDSGRFWHLQGFAVWRGLEEGSSSATRALIAMRALNRSVALLQGIDAPGAQAYLARVFDTYGQMLQHQGLLYEARREFEQALEKRQAMGDTVGEAWTLGNLGRLCLDLGDYAAAEGYLIRDLEMVQQLSPEQRRLCAQLLSHLGVCAAGQGDVQRAQDYFLRSTSLVQTDHDAYGLAFADLGMGQVALQRGHLVYAEQLAERAWAHMASLGEPSEDQEGIRGLISQLRAEIHLARTDARRSIDAFETAQACFLRTPRVSVMEMARLLYGYAKAHHAAGEDQQAAHLLREALRYLDASSDEHLHQQIEAMLRTHFQESWLLHSTGRFIGQQYMDFLLTHAGHREFRGSRQDVVTLFCDLRDFTTLSEQFAAEPEAFVTILNDYLRHMTRCVEHFGGLVSQFSGDGVMAIFSLPAPRPADDAERAVLCALMMQEELKRFYRTLSHGMPQLTVGVGLHAGPVIAGLYGSPQKRTYTVNGDAVNTAARLESLTKHLGASMLISNEVSGRLPTPHRFLLRPLGSYRLKGKTAAVKVFDVMGEDDSSRFAKAVKTEIAYVREALEHFSRCQFGEAHTAFTAMAATAQQAGNASRAQGYQFLANTAESYRKAPPSAAWDGTIIMEEK
jgi:class 3 adenylate cyclase/Tfp pilus assembly protein PilF